MQSSTIRISNTSHNILKELAARSGESMQAILDQAIEQYRRQVFLESANQAYAALRNNSEAWQAELEEREVWDVTLADTLE
ncbi:toxin-antitoxin system protein [Hassallia byssoidea VB512170]|uniref:Toxin-antitoxin system protein n=1 Tax=Hassallia byssoidea VB512170 TaxID=1304833 RepID=A0A846H329_9CYAN|nr:toxin-antitoxin system protein [Hassalia byssoidea]NEU71458.1 toxin-antitoxin system protein [Hassalia byssoidea VB512170]